MVDDDDLLAPLEQRDHDCPKALSLAELRQALAVLGCAVGSPTGFPSIHRLGAWSLSRSRTVSASRTGIDIR